MTVKYNHIEAAAKLSASRGFAGLKKGLGVMAATVLLSLPFSVPAYAAGESKSIPSPVQAGVSPYVTDYGIIAPVQMAGSDNESAAFQKNYLPAIQSFIASTLPEYRDNSSTVASLSSIDPTKLTVRTSNEVRVYFVGAGTGSHNAFGYGTVNSPVENYDRYIFPEVSSNISYDGSGKQVRTMDDPLLPGDFVDLKKLVAGEKLSFFYYTDVDHDGVYHDWFTTYYSKYTEDRISHSLIYAMPDSPYMLIAFEDRTLMKGSDMDYNDLVIAVSGLTTTPTVDLYSLTSAPEPPTLLVFGSFLLLALFLGKRFGMQDATMAVASGALPPAGC